MLRILSILLFVLPCIEIWIFINLTFIMSLSTILLQSTVTMAAGFWLAQGENISLWTLIKSELLNKRIPAEELLDDLIIWCGGILLIIPGLLTDAIGIVIFIPTIRQEIIKWMRNRIKKSLRLPPLF